MERIVRTPRELTINCDQVLHCGYFGGQDDTVAREPDLFGACGGEERRLHHRLARHLARVARVWRAGVLVHQPHQKLLIERAPIRADAHRLAVLDRGLDNRAELPVLLFLEPDVAGIDPILVERLRAGRMIGQEFMADVMKIADDRYPHAHLQQPLLDARDRGCRLVAVDRRSEEHTSELQSQSNLVCRLLLEKKKKKIKKIMNKKKKKKK